MSNLFLMECLWIAWIGSSGASGWGIHTLSPHTFWVFDQGKWGLHALLSAVDSAIWLNVVWQWCLNFARSCVDGSSSPLWSLQKNNNRHIAYMQISRLDFLLRLLLISMSIEIVIGALFGWNEDEGLNFSMPFMICFNLSLPCYGNFLLLCSFFIAEIFALT